MTVQGVTTDVLKNCYDNGVVTEEQYTLWPRIEYLTVLPCPTVTIEAAIPGAPQAPAGCPAVLKYSGNPIQLRATPRDGIGPYLVEFYKDEVLIPFGRLTSPVGITTNPTTKSIVENTDVGGTYILHDIDVANAIGGRINFSVYIEDSCPTGPMNCGSTCTIDIGCIAPVCNFVVT